MLSPSSFLLVSFREALAPFLKNEEARLMAENGVKRTPFQYVLYAATSPAVKQQEETLTYLNQGSYLSTLTKRTGAHFVTCNPRSCRVSLRTAVVGFLIH